LHGSGKCWRKFINCGAYYKADVLILGGDMTGKATVPVVKQSDGTFKSNFMNREYILKTPKELEGFEDKLDVAGFYSHCTDEETVQKIMSNEKEQNTLFSQKMIERIEQWIKFADERLAGTNMKCYVCPGNDDEYEIDEIIGKSKYVTNAEGKVIRITDDNEMISSGFSTPTPWKTPREISDEELAKKIESLASQVDNMENCIFALHDPPRDTPLDEAQAIDKNLKATVGDTMHVGSLSVRNSIIKYQPLLGLHGHIHESRGFCKLGKTLCTNPGSVYGTGTLQNASIVLNKNKVEDLSLLTG
jgi:Icc-related predicted phosphoesterase